MKKIAKLITSQETGNIYLDGSGPNLSVSGSSSYWKISSSVTLK